MNKSNPSHLLILLSLIPLLSTCNILISEPVVFTAGQAGSPGLAARWRNTTMTNLPGPGSNGSRANSLRIVGGDIYIGGYYIDSLGNQHPCYWRNGSLVELDLTGTQGLANDIFFTRGNVYSAGLDVQSSSPYPCLWIGTRQIMLSSDSGYAMKLFVSSDAIYILGFNITGTTEVRFWKYSGSGPVPVPTPLPFNPGSTGNAFSIFISNGIPLISGWFLNGASHTPCYWTDLERTDLALPPAVIPNSDSAASTLCVDAGVVHSGGYYNDGTRNIPCYWKGTAFTALPVPPTSTDGYVSSICALQGVVYTAGYYISGGLYRACYWKGTEFVELPSDASSDARAYAIFVE